MSKETLEHLNALTLIGFTDKRGSAWHYRAELQGLEPNHYTGAIPVGDVRRRLFDWAAVEGQITATALTPDGVVTYSDAERKAIMRSDTGQILGVFKSGYRIHQYDEWLIENVESILDADLQVGSAGVLRGGAQAWVQVELEDTLSVEGVEYRPFLTAATSMDGSLSTTYMTGAQVVVCDNTLRAAVGTAAESVKVRHSAHSLGRIGSVRDALSIVHGVADSFAEEVARLVATPVTERQWGAFLDVLVGDPAGMKEGRGATLAERKRDELSDLWRADGRVSPWAGTAWGVLAAVNTHAHHLLPVRGAGRAERNMERMVSGYFDTLDSNVLGALDMVLAG